MKNPENEVKKEFVLGQIAYFKNGKKVKIISKYGADSYFVRYLYLIDAFAIGIDDEEIGGEITIARETNLYHSPPKHALDEEIANAETKKQKIAEETEDLRAENRKLKYEIELLRDQASKLQEGVVNISHLKKAKTIGIFQLNKLSPRIIGTENIFRINFSYVLGQKDRKYLIHIVNNDYETTIRDISLFLINPTEEELIKAAHKRCEEIELTDYRLLRADDKWLTDEAKAKKAIAKAQHDQKEKERIARNIEQIQTQLEKYEAELVELNDPQSNQ